VLRVKFNVIMKSWWIISRNHVILKSTCGQRNYNENYVNLHRTTLSRRHCCFGFRNDNSTR